MKKKQRKREVSYQVFFILGICFIALGVVFVSTDNPAFIGFAGMGLIFMIIGLANRDKWAKSKKET